MFYSALIIDVSIQRRRPSSMITFHTELRVIAVSQLIKFGYPIPDSGVVETPAGFERGVNSCEMIRPGVRRISSVQFIKNNFIGVDPNTGENPLAKIRIAITEADSQAYVHVDDSAFENFLNRAASLADGDQVPAALR